MAYDRTVYDGSAGSGRMLGDVVAGRDNNLNLIRMLAATGVLVSHAFPVSLGPGAAEPLSRLLGMSLGEVSVAVFFAISGLLIARSWETGGSLLRFWRARALRILPGLAVVLVLTILAGALVTEAPAGTYWPAAASYVLRNLTLVSMQYDLPGIFPANPYGGAINGSLWTLFHEVVCYGGIMVLGLLGILRSRRWMALAFLAFLALHAAVLILEPHPKLVSLARLALPFMIGATLHVWRDRVRLSVFHGAILAVAAALSHGTPLFAPLFVLALSYATFLAAYLPGGSIRAWNRLGDYSYGTYIYAFPLQQAVAAAGVASPLLNIALALPLTLLCAVLSWTLVEKPALALARGRDRASRAG